MTLDSSSSQIPRKILSALGWGNKEFAPVDPSTLQLVHLQNYPNGVTIRSEVYVLLLLFVT